MKVKLQVHLAAAMAAFILAVSPARGAVTGHWDFDGGDLAATIGAALEFLDGAGGATETGTRFGTTTSLGIPDIGGQPAMVMQFPRMANSSMGYRLTHGAAPNGGGSQVNQYTLIMDIFYPTESSGKYRSLTQTDNGGDGDFFLNPGNGIGISGSYAGNVTGGAWHRIALAVDLTGAQPVVSKFIDGVKVADQVLGSGLDGRWSLPPFMHFLNDEDGESETGYLNSLQIRDTKLSDTLIGMLGGPSAGGIPTTELPEHPFVDATVPANGATGVDTNTVISAVIMDGQNAVLEGSIQMTLNGAAVAPDLSKVGLATTVSYQSPGLLPGTTNRVTLVFADATGSFTNTWTFVTKPLDQPPGITGQWDFDEGDLRATVGLALEYFDGPTGTTAAQTQFGTTTSFGIPDIGGAPATVLRFPGAATAQIGYLMAHGATANGGGGKVNQWTLILDILLPHANGEEWFSILQIDDVTNGGDGDLFASFGSGTTAGLGISGQYSGALVGGQWHRVALAVDAAGAINKYIDGVQVGVQSDWSGRGLDGRHALFPTAILFGDEDEESQPAFVNSVQVRNYTMRPEEIAALGGPSPDGVPTVSGQWDFENADFAATIGSALRYRDDDPFFTLFEPATIGSQTANVLHFTGVASTDGYILPHGALPNGGGQKVNQYSLIMDLMYPASSTGFRSLFQTETNNADDGDLFVNGGNGIGISGQYQGQLVPDTWHRVVFTFDLTRRELGKYVDGANVLTAAVGAAPLGTGPYQYLSATSGGVDGNWALEPTALLFADNDGELGEGYVNSIQFRVGVLSPAQVARLGGPSAAGIPVNLPLPPRLSLMEDFGNLILSWPLEYTGYTLERSATLGSSADWDPVEGVENNTVVVLPTEATGFFRLRK